MGRKRALYTASVLRSMALAFAWQAKVSPVPASRSVEAISALSLKKGKHTPDYNYHNDHSDIRLICMAMEIIQCELKDCTESTRS